MHQYKAVQTENNDFVLVKDGMQAMCPKTQPRAVVSNVGGQAQMVRFPCSTNCPFATIEIIGETTKSAITEAPGIKVNESTKTKYVIQCEGAHVSIELSEIVKKGEAKIATLIAQ